MHIVKRKIKGREYFFAEKSVRLPDRSVRKLSVSAGRKTPKIDELKLRKVFCDKEKNLFANWALKHLGFEYPLTQNDISQVERLKVDYKHVMKGIPKQRIRDLIDRFTVNFTYESNAIEGNSLTLKDVAIVIFEKETIPGKTLREIYETRNHRDAIELLFRKKIKMTHQLIIKVHKLFMRDIEEQLGYKKLPNFILGSPVKTSPPEQVYDDMTELLQWHQKNSSKMHPLQLAALFHGRFLKIHPFADGNGRVARMLSNAILVNNGYPPIIVRKTNRTKYMGTLRAFDSKHPENLVRFFLERYKRTFNNFFAIYARYV
jgi:fido (protein-threonine AMPylation protein)